MTALAESSGELERRAGEARAAGQPGLARESLARKDAVEAELGGLRNQDQSLRQQADRLAAASRRLQRLQAKTGARRSQEQAGERTAYPGLTSYDAWYVALAEFLGVKLATLDTRLAFVPGPRCGFCLPPPPPASAPARAPASATMTIPEPTPAACRARGAGRASHRSRRGRCRTCATGATRP